MIRRLWKVPDVAEFFQVRSATVYGWVESGRLPHLRVGNCIRFEEQAVVDWARKGGDNATSTQERSQAG